MADGTTTVRCLACGHEAREGLLCGSCYGRRLRTLYITCPEYRRYLKAHARRLAELICESRGWM